MRRSPPDTSFTLGSLERVTGAVHR